MMTSWLSARLVVDRRVRGAERKRDGNRGPALRSALDANLAVMAAHISLADTEAEPGSLSALGGEKRLENVGQHVGRNAATGIGDVDLDRIRRQRERFAET